MGKHLEEKSLIAVNKKSLFYRIKMFFWGLFKGKKSTEFEPKTETAQTAENQSSSIQKDTFMESIRNIENEETKLLKLQKQFDNREIDKNQLSKKQIADLTELYKKQISDLEQSNERRINKIKQYKNGESFLKEIRN